MMTPSGLTIKWKGNFSADNYNLAIQEKQHWLSKQSRALWTSLPNLGITSWKYKVSSMNTSPYCSIAVKKRKKIISSEFLGKKKVWLHHCVNSCCICFSNIKCSSGILTSSKKKEQKKSLKENEMIHGRMTNMIRSTKTLPSEKQS